MSEIKDWNGTFLHVYFEPKDRFKINDIGGVDAYFTKEEILEMIGRIVS